MKWLREIFGQENKPEGRDQIDSGETKRKPEELSTWEAMNLDDLKLEVEERGGIAGKPAATINEGIAHVQKMAVGMGDDITALTLDDVMPMVRDKGLAWKVIDLLVNEHEVRGYQEVTSIASWDDVIRLVTVNIENKQHRVRAINAAGELKRKAQMVSLKSFPIGIRELVANFAGADRSFHLLYDVEEALEKEREVLAKEDAEKS